MKTAGLMFAVATAASVVLLAACGSGSAEKETAGTLVEAKQSTAEAQPAVTEPAAAATTEAAQQAAADEAAKAATEDDAAGAAKADGKNGKQADGIRSCC